MPINFDPESAQDDQLPVNGFPPEAWSADLPSDPIWTAAYSKAIEIFGLRHDLAVEFADSTLRLTRGHQ